MKNIGFVFCFVLSTSLVFGQQFLWSTNEDTDSEHVPIKSVTSVVLEFYDHYEYYYDGSGYSKDRFLDYIKKYGDNSEDWKSFKDKIYEVEDLTVNAFKGNLGRGSFVFITIISKKYVDFIYFSNAYESYTIETDSHERGKFKKWFRTLLIQGDPNSSVLEEISTGSEVDKLNGETDGLFGQSGISTGDGKVGGGLGNRDGLGPRINDKSQTTGSVVVKVCVDARGNVVHANFTLRGSTIVNSQLCRLAEANARKWKFKPGELDKQCGTIIYDFQVK